MIFPEFSVFTSHCREENNCTQDTRDEIQENCRQGFNSGNGPQSVPNQAAEKLKLKKNHLNQSKERNQAIIQQPLV